MAQTLLEQACVAESCFHAEQAGQLALKAFLYRQGARSLTLHSVRELTQRCLRHDPAWQQVVDAATILDQYDIPTRDPDAIGFPGVPFKTYSRRHAREAVQLARTIVELVASKV